MCVSTCVCVGVQMFRCVFVCVSVYEHPYIPLLTPLSLTDFARNTLSYV